MSISTSQVVTVYALPVFVNNLRSFPWKWNNISNSIDYVVFLIHFIIRSFMFSKKENCIKFYKYLLVQIMFK